MNHALWVALNLSRITHFSCKFLGPKKSACVNVLTYSTSGSPLTISQHSTFSPLTISQHFTFPPLTISQHSTFPPLTISQYSRCSPLTISQHYTFSPLTISQHSPVPSKQHPRLPVSTETAQVHRGSSSCGGVRPRLQHRFMSRVTDGGDGGIINQAARGHGLGEITCRLTLLRI